MITGILLGVQTLGPDTKQATKSADNHAIEHGAKMRAMNVDEERGDGEGLDVVGAPLYWLEAIEPRDGSAEDRSFSFDESDSDADVSFDFTPTLFHAATDESHRELRVEAYDPTKARAADEMRAAGLFGGVVAPAVPDDMLESYRQRDPTVDFAVIPYVL